MLVLCPDYLSEALMFCLCFMDPQRFQYNKKAMVNLNLKE